MVEGQTVVQGSPAASPPGSPEVAGEPAGGGLEGRAQVARSPASIPSGLRGSSTSSSVPVSCTRSPATQPLLDADAEGGQDDEPEHLLCPISRCMFRDPVFVPGSGNTYEREAIERFWALEKGTKRDPLTNTPLVKGERTLFTNWHVRREVAGFLERQAHLTPSGWPDRVLPPPQPTTSVSNATEEVRTARERAVARERRRHHQGGLLWGRWAAGGPAGDRQLQSFLVLASLLTVNVVVCLLSRRLTSSGGALIGHPFSPLVRSHSSDLGWSRVSTSAMDPASVLPPACDAYMRTDVSDASAAGAVSGPGKWMLPLPDTITHGRRGSNADASVQHGTSVQYGSDRRLRVSYSRVLPQQHCLSPRRCTIHDDRNPRLRISISARHPDWTICVLVMWTCLWIVATAFWTGWSITVYWRWVPRGWRGDGEDLLLLPTAALSVLFTAPFWAISATLLLQCAVACLAHTEMELSPTSWSLHSTMPGGWELERAMGDVDDIASLGGVDAALWMPWPLDSAGVASTTKAGDEFGVGAMWLQAQQTLLGTTAVQLSLESKSWKVVAGETDVHREPMGSDGITGDETADSHTRSQDSPHASEREGVREVEDETDEKRMPIHPTRNYQFGHGLSKEGTAELVNVALTYLCRRQSSQPAY